MDKTCLSGESGYDHSLYNHSQRQSLITAAPSGRIYQCAVPQPSSSQADPDVSMSDIQALTPDLHELWDSYVRQHPEGSFFHLSGWKTVLEEAFQHRTHYLLILQNGEIHGLLPLVHVKSLLFGNSLSSLAFCASAGIIASSPNAADVLRARAVELASELNVDSLEMRNTEQQSDDWQTQLLYFNFKKKMAADAESMMKEIPRKQRAMVRKGIKNGLVSAETDDVERLHGIYSESVRNLGTPVFSRKYFRVLQQVFGDQCRSLVVTHEGKDVAGVLSFYFKDQVLPYYGGGLAVGRRLAANDFMYWELMRRSREEGIEVFDFGRSKSGSGSFSFKKNWGFEPEQLVYEHYLVKSKEIPEINPNNPKYTVFIKAWKKLPLPVSNLIGPLLSRSLG